MMEFYADHFAEDTLIDAAAAERTPTSVAHTEHDPNTGTVVRIRGNSRHTQKGGFHPSDITVEITAPVDDPDSAARWASSIRRLTLAVHRELAEACREINDG